MLQIIDYYPYGSKRLEESSDVSQREYIGEMFDEDTNLSYLNARYLDSATAKFRSVDTVARDFDTNSAQGKLMLLDPQLQNSYSYVGNNPLIARDPNGEFIQVVAGATIGGAIGGLTTAIMGGDLRQTGAAILGGAVAGASFSLAGPVGVSQTIGAGMGSNLLGASIARSVAGNDVTPGTLAVDATVGAAGGALGYGAVKGVNAFLEASQAAVGGKAVTSILNPPGSGLSTERAFHVLFGDGGRSGGHLWPGAPGKTPFPADWSPEKILQTITSISENNSLVARPGIGGRTIVEDFIGGVNVRVILGSPRNTDKIITGHPTNLTRNP